MDVKKQVQVVRIALYIKWINDMEEIRLKLKKVRLLMNLKTKIAHLIQLLSCVFHQIFSLKKQILGEMVVGILLEEEKIVDLS